MHLNQLKKPHAQEIVLASGILIMGALFPTGTSAQKEQGTGPSRVEMKTELESGRALEQTIEDLNFQMASLIEEVQRLKSGHAALMTLWKLTLYEQREEYVRRKLDGPRARLQSVDGREESLRRRLETLDGELIITNTISITQEKARERIKKQMGRELEKIAQQCPEMKEQESVLEEELEWVNRILQKVKTEMRVLEQKEELPDEMIGVEPNP